MIDSYKEMSLKKFCIDVNVKAGLSQEDAEKACSACSDTEPIEQTSMGSVSSENRGSDSLGIKGREATALERCVSCRMDIHGEDVETATRTCIKMFNDATMRHAFESGDPWAQASVLNQWSQLHSMDPYWVRWRDENSTKEVQRERAIDAIIEEIQGDSNDPDHILPRISLRTRAEHLYEIRAGKREADVRRELLEARQTVRTLFGKTRSQIIAEDAEKQPSDRLTVGSLYGKTRKQILEESK